MEAFNRRIVQGIYSVMVKIGEKLIGMGDAWVAKVSRNPHMVMVFPTPKNYTHELIKRAGYFTIDMGLWGRGNWQAFWAIEWNRRR